jgi:hypothetical protein
LESPFFQVESWGWPPVERGSVPVTAAPSLPRVEKVFVIKNLDAKKTKQQKSEEEP